DSRGRRSAGSSGQSRRRDTAAAATARPQRPPGAARRSAGAGCRARSGSPRKQRAGCAEPPAVTDESVAGDERDAGVVDLPPARLVLQLLDRMREPDPAATGAALTAGELSAARVDRQLARDRGIRRLDERRTLPLRADAVPLELNRHHDRVVVVKLAEIDVAACESRLLEQPLRI